MYTLKFSFEDKVRQPIVVKNVNAGQSVLEIALKNHIGLQHECGGICACGTCHVYVANGNHFLEPASRRETAYIKRVYHPLPSSRLSCQCILKNGNGVVEITVPEPGF
jgi:ferredoxin, 2Fe-2S